MFRSFADQSHMPSGADGIWVGSRWRFSITPHLMLLVSTLGTKTEMSFAVVSEIDSVTDLQFISFENCNSTSIVSVPSSLSWDKIRASCPGEKYVMDGVEATKFSLGTSAINENGGKVKLLRHP
jgi:hypothetical protein